MSASHVSPADLEPQIMDAYEGRMAQLGDLNVSFEKMPGDFPPPELWKGLPDDHCPCPHWGYVIKGAFAVHYPDGSEEVVRAGEAYHLRPGHLCRMLEPTELVEFSPKAQFDAMMAHVEGNVAALMGADTPA
jgi:hypothetical protein